MSGMSFSFGDMLARGSVVALPLVLVGGLLAGMNPCCLALYPAAASCCAPGSANTQHPTRHVLAFVLGAASATSVLGLFAALAGRVMGQLGTPARYVIAAIPIVMGLHLVGFLRLPLSSVPSRLVPSNLVGAFGCGFLVSVAVTPCSTPILASVLSYVAYKGRALYGAILLFVYGIGVGMPLFVVGTAASGLTRRLERYGYRRWGEGISGTALIILGLYLVWKA